MRHTDERILENLSEEGQATAWMLASDIGVDERFIQYRLRILADAEFVERVVGEKTDKEWDITTWGKGYLSGEIDAKYRQPEQLTRPPGKIRPGWYAGFG
jgi:hypothetical protein